MLGRLCCLQGSKFLGRSNGQKRCVVVLIPEIRG